jgi:hypothetical protein
VTKFTRRNGAPFGVAGGGRLSNHPVFASLQMKPDKVNVKAGEERKAAISAKAQLRHLTPASARTDRMIFRLRHAANVETLRRRQH